ncbi:MAG: DUF4272 domain-containing protein [Thermoanaerobaculia bacterium]
MQETRERSRARLMNEGVPISHRLPLLERIGTPRGPKQVADRIVVLYALIGLAHDADPGKLLRWLRDIRCEGALEPQERGLLEKERITNEEEKRLSWLQEALVFLMWAGSLQPELGRAYGECDIDEVLPRIPPEVAVSTFRKSLVLRPIEELLDEADYLYQLHWALRHPEVWREQVLYLRFSRDVVIERRRAIEWLLHRRASWWEISLDT